MVISDSHRFIFLAVPKTGTSSIELALEPYRSPITAQFNKHATCSRLQRDLPGEVWQSYFKFAFVRNPYDLMQSWYFYRQREELAAPEHPRHHLYTGNLAFEEFILGFAKNELMLRQVDFIAPYGRGVQVDFVGKYETLEQDFQQICEHLGLDPVRLRRVRASGNEETGVNIWSRVTRKVVNDYFAEDFTTFGYDLVEV